MGLSLKSWVTNEGGKHCVLVVWVGVSVWIFWRTYRLYCSGPEYYYLHNMLGPGLCVSRASASVLNLNCSLVLLPMCRSILTVLRGQTQLNSRKFRRLLDKSKTFHVACGVAICIFSEFLRPEVAYHHGNNVTQSITKSVREREEEGERWRKRESDYQLLNRS